MFKMKLLSIIQIIPYPRLSTLYIQGSMSTYQRTYIYLTLEGRVRVQTCDLLYARSNFVRQTP